jgi:hypothetical protein
MIYLRHFLSVIAHKYYVAIACRRVGGVPFRRWLTHDLSKFSRAEFGPYARKFQGHRKDTAAEFSRAWRHHYAINDHHWNHWRFYDDQKMDYTYYPMPDHCLREMIADWMGAGRLYKGSWDISPWLKSNFVAMPLHPETRAKVEKILLSMGYTWL